MGVPQQNIEEQSVGSRKQDSNGRWLPGTTGNAAGRGMTNRQRISEKLLADLARVWEEHGVAQATP